MQKSLLAKTFLRNDARSTAVLLHGRTQSLQNIYVLSVRIISRGKKVCLQGLFAKRCKEYSRALSTEGRSPYKTFMFRLYVLYRNAKKFACKDFFAKRCKEYSRAFARKDAVLTKHLCFVCTYYSIQNAVLQQYDAKKTRPSKFSPCGRGVS